MARIGILALQGGVALHQSALTELGHQSVLVRGPEQLDDLEGLILPGGESTTQLKLIDSAGLSQPLHRLHQRGVPVLATCAGLILAARRVLNPNQAGLGWLDIGVARNAHGRQLDSFEAVSDEGRMLIFIRAPRIVEVGPGAEVLDRLQGEPVLVRQGAVTGACFHPELGGDLLVHRDLFGVTATSGVVRGAA